MTTPTITAHEPGNDARVFAAMLWDHFRALREQGFTETQALVLLGNMMGSAIAGGQHEQKGPK